VARARAPASRTTAAALLSQHQAPAQRGWLPAPGGPLALSDAALARGGDLLQASMALSSSPGSDRAAMARLGSGASGAGLACAASGSGGSGGGSPTGFAAAAAAAAAAQLGGSPPPVSAVDQFLAAAAAAAAANQAAAAAAQLASAGSGSFAVQTDTDGCCPTLPSLSGGLVSSASGSTAGSGGDDAPRKLAVLGLLWETM
jgi:hypothetical protein